MKPRPAEFYDVPDILNLGEQMVAEAPLLQDKPFARARAEKVVEECIYYGGCFLVEDQHGFLVGMGLGTIIEDFWVDRKVFVDYAIYVVPSARRGRLAFRIIAALEEWAVNEGAEAMFLGISTGIQDERTGRLYQRLGYQFCGVNYSKALAPVSCPGA